MALLWGKKHAVIAKSKYFNEQWYLQKYPDVAAAGMDAAMHYMNYGWREGRNPGPDFNTSIYLSNYPDVASSGMCPLVHFERIGRAQGREYSVSIHDKSSVINSYMEKYNVASGIAKMSDADIHFSIVMPTYNRADSVCRAIDSVMGQTYKKFELIIVDDGSSDNTSELIKSKYATELSSGQIQYIYQANSGVCRARNKGLQHAQYDWIAYIDSDNVWFNNFLDTFTEYIMSSQSKCLYAMRIMQSNGAVDGRGFNWDNLLHGNYIDLGSFVHHIDLYKALGGFDENMTRLVDWDFVVRYTRDNVPEYIQRPVFLYDDLNDRRRISNMDTYEKNLSYFNKKYSITDKANHKG